MPTTNNAEYVILVNEAGEQTGVEEKVAAHQKGVLHRAFSIFIFDNLNRMLIQQRGLDKYHFAGLWSNACCSHPRTRETIGDAAQRRLKEELGFNTEIKEAFSFIYKIQDEASGLYEHEFDHVLVGLYDGNIDADSNEINDYRWIELEKLEKEVLDIEKLFTPWFKIAIQKLKDHNLYSWRDIEKFLLS